MTRALKRYTAVLFFFRFPLCVPVELDLTWPRSLCRLSPQTLRLGLCCRKIPPGVVSVVCVFFLFLLKVPMASVSGLAITSLQVFNEKYRPYKGVRTLTKAGKNFQVRTG